MVFFPRYWHGTRPKNGENVFLFLLLLFNRHFDILLYHFFIPSCYLSFQFPVLQPSFLLCRQIFLSVFYFYFSFIFILSNFDQLKQKLSNKKISPLHLSSAFFSFFSSAFSCNGFFSIKYFHFILFLYPRLSFSLFSFLF